jgi:hypothetical protein
MSSDSLANRARKAFAEEWKGQYGGKSIMRSLHSGLARLRRSALPALAIALCAAAPAMAATLNGTVKNGTTGRPVPGAEVVLMELQQGMVPVAKVKTDARGRFHFANSALGQEPMLLETSYGGVSYYQPIAPDDATGTIVVYERTSDPKAITVASRAIVFQPNGANLQVEEQFLVENQTKPPVAYYVNTGTFTFSLPESAQLGRVSTWTATSNMPTLQNPIDAPKNRKALDWAFRPGKSIVKIDYLLPYASNQATIRTRSPYSATHVFLAVPPGIQLSSDGFDRIGSQDGYDIYGHQSLPAETALVISISGTASTSSAPNASTASADSADTGVLTLPGRLHNLTWILAACIAVLLALATMFLLRKRTLQPAAAFSGTAGEAQAAAATPILHDPGHEEKLDRIKEEFLQLELRHQAGTLNDGDYARERRKLEVALRAFVRG